MSTDATPPKPGVRIPGSIEQVDLRWVRTNVLPRWFKDLTLEEWCLEYRRFLTLKLVAPDPSRIVPSDGVDRIWHEHILRTRAYREDCDRIFGRYLDHDPEFGVDERGRQTPRLLAAWDYTKSAYRSSFGEDPPPAPWDRPMACG